MDLWPIICLYCDSQALHDLILVRKDFAWLTKFHNPWWKLKFIQDFGLPSWSVCSWRRAYYRYGRQYVYGFFPGLMRTYIGQTKHTYRHHGTLLHKRATKVILSNDSLFLCDIQGQTWVYGSLRNRRLTITPPNDWPDNTLARPHLCTKLTKPIRTIISVGEATQRDFILLLFEDNTSTFVGDIRDGSLMYLAKEIHYDSLQRIVWIDINNNLWYAILERDLNTLVVKEQITVWGLKAKSIVAGYHSLIIDMDDRLWVTGNNGDGQLGIGHNNYNIDDYVSHPEFRVKQVALGWEHSVILDFAGNVYVCGSNSKNQLGFRKRTPPITTWTKVEGIKGQQIACQSNCTIILDTDYNVWITGTSVRYGLGLGKKSRAKTFTQIPKLKAIAIYAQGTAMVITKHPSYLPSS